MVQRARSCLALRIIDETREAPLSCSEDPGRVLAEREEYRVCDVRFAAPVWSQQSEQFGGTHIKRHAIQSCAIPVAMHQILYRNYGRGGGDSNLGVGASNGVCGHIGNHRLFYDETVLSIIRANKRGK